MNKQIWKYEIKNYYCTLDMPVGAELLSVQLQDEKIVVWALIDQYADTEERHFEIMSTGKSFCDEGTKYIGTVQEVDDSVWHLFEVNIKS